MLGVNEGDFEGAFVGKSVGVMLGTNEGDIEGAFVGTMLG
jgi:hypothetical protein